MTPEHGQTTFADFAGQAAQQSLIMGNFTLGLLLAEMQALGAMMPGVQPETESEARSHDAEVEASFDNMPV